MANKPTVSVDWFNVKTGEKVYTSRPAQIKAFINSSNLGVNRQSDRGWRIGKEWYKKLKMARQDRSLMTELAKESGGEVEEAQLLVAVFNRELLAQREMQRYDDQAPFEQEYEESLREIDEEQDKKRARVENMAKAREAKINRTSVEGGQSNG